MRALVVAFLCGLSALTPSIASACSCDSSRSFLESAARANVRAVVIARVRALGPLLSPTSDWHTYMDIEVLELLKGKAPSVGSSAEVFGDNGMFCREDITPGRFQVGNTYVLALDEAFPSESEKPSPLALSSCGTYWLALDGDTVNGRVSGLEPQTLTLQEFREALAGALAAP